MYIKKNKKIKKILPHCLEAEYSILGGLMLDNSKWDEVYEKINSNDFFNYPNKLIFEEMRNLIKLGKPIDLITLSESFKKKKKLKIIGGFAYLAELSKNTPSVANIITYTDIVYEKSIIRQIIYVANKISDAGYNLKYKNSEELLDYAESKIFRIGENKKKKCIGPKEIKNLVKDTINKIEKLYEKSGNGLTGISSGYIDLDKKTAGLQKSDLIIIASRPSMGKTTFAMNLCENIAIKENKPVLIFSLEMSSEQIMMRILSSLSKVDQNKIRTGQLNDKEWSRISNSMKILLKKKNIYIDDAPRLTPTEIRTRSRKIFKENKGLSLIMVDYLQLMKVASWSDNRTLEIAEISRSLKSLAKELKVPVIALSQLNRSLELRSDKRPINSDLRESGSIEQDADLIIFIYRDEIYNEKTELKGIAEIILGKQRNGPIGSIRLIFNGHLSRFDNYSNINYF